MSPNYITLQKHTTRIMRINYEAGQLISQKTIEEALTFKCLIYLLSFDRVAEHSTENNMDSKNLAICFWPTLLRPEFTSFEKMTLVSKQLEEIIVCLIDEPDFYFGSQNET